MNRRWRIQGERRGAGVAAGVCAVAAVCVFAGCGGGGGAQSGNRWTPPADYGPSLAEQVQTASRLAREAQDEVAEGRPDRAITLYRQAVEAYRDFPAAWNNLGRLLMDYGNGMDAFAALKTAADLDPRDPRPVYNMGKLWADRGYAKDASRYFAEALERDPSYLPALQMSIYVDRIMLGIENEDVATRIRRASLLERDERWKEFLERERIRLDERPRVGRTFAP